MDRTCGRQGGGERGSLMAEPSLEDAAETLNPQRPRHLLAHFAPSVHALGLFMPVAKQAKTFPI